MKKKIYLFIFSMLFLMPLSYSQSALTKAEYFLDNTDPGIGNGTPITIVSGDSVIKTFQLPTVGLNVCYHTIGIRVRNANGLWSTNLWNEFYIHDTISCNYIPISIIIPPLNNAEYFINTDPGIGNATPITIVSGDSVTKTFQFPTTGLNVGRHTIVVRVRNANGLWSPAINDIFYIHDTISSSPISIIIPPLNNAEYFFDNNDPGPGNGISINVIPGDSIIWSGNISLGTLLPGQHKITIRTRNSKGLWSIAKTETFTVVDCLHPVAGFSIPSEICLGDTLFINDTSTSIHSTESICNWDIGNDGTVDDTTMGSIYTVLTDTGIYPVKLYILNQGVCSDSAIHNVTVRPIPQAVIAANGNTSFCQGNMVILNANTGPGLLYNWHNNNLPLGATYSVFGANLNGTYKALITNQYGCEKFSNEIPVTLYPLPNAIITPSGPTSICDGDSVTLNANTGTGLSYLWKRNGDTISGQTASSIAVSDGGNYVVEITNSNNCQAASTPITITVNALPNSIITPGGSTNLCQGELLQLYATSGIGYSYEWLDNGSIMSGVTSSSFNVVQSGNYQVVITNSNQCIDTSSTQAVTVNPLPSAAITASGPTSFCVGNSVTLNANTGTAYTYVWKKNGNVLTAQNSSSLIVSDAGNYLVEISNSYSCTSVSNAIAINVNPIPNSTITVGGSATICQGDVLQLYGTSGTGYSYQWLNNGSPIIWFNFFVSHYHSKWKLSGDCNKCVFLF